jgi:hypothetical protein
MTSCGNHIGDDPTESTSADHRRRCRACPGDSNGPDVDGITLAVFGRMGKIGSHWSKARAARRRAASSPASCASARAMAEQAVAMSSRPVEVTTWPAISTQ